MLRLRDEAQGLRQVRREVLRSMDVGVSRCYLHYAPRRVVCEEHGVVTEAMTWADPKARLTRILDDQIAWAM